MLFESTNTRKSRCFCFRLIPTLPQAKSDCCGLLSNWQRQLVSFTQQQPNLLTVKHRFDYVLTFSKKVSLDSVKDAIEKCEKSQFDCRNDLPNK
jgi:hypothetical protein